MSRGVNRKIGCCKCVIASQCIYSISICISFRSKKKQNKKKGNEKKRVHVYISFSRFDLDILFLFCVPEMMRCLNLGLEFEICWVLII